LEEKYHPSLSLERPFGHFQEFSSTAPQSTCSHLLISPLASNTTTGLSRSTSLSYSNPYQTKYTYCCLKLFFSSDSSTTQLKPRKPTKHTIHLYLKKPNCHPSNIHIYIHAFILLFLPSFLIIKGNTFQERKTNGAVRTYPSMETRVESSQTASARSLSSSPSSSSSFSASIVPLISYSPVQTTDDQGTTAPAHDGSLGSTQLLQNGEVSMAESGIEGLRFVNVTGSGGMEWKDVDERFDRLALTKNGPEPVVNWSDFGFCIGENHNFFLPFLFSLK
jgi:hypothetical protein